MGNTRKKALDDDMVSLQKYNVLLKKFNELQVKEMRVDSLTTLHLPDKKIGLVQDLDAQGLDACPGDVPRGERLEEEEELEDPALRTELLP